MLTIKSSVFLKKFQRFFSVLETACQAGHAAPPFSLPSAVGIPSADTAARRWRRLYAQSERVHLPPSAAGECRAHGRGKRGQGHRMVPLPPLDSPKTLLCAATPFGRAAKRELRGLGSGRRADFGTLSGPEVSLRKPQRCQCAAIRCRAQTPSLRPPDRGQACPRRKKSTDLHLCSFG